MLLGATLAALSGPAAAQPRGRFCEGGLGIALLDIPAAAEKDPRARTYIVDHAQPGDRLERRIRVCNGGTQDLPVRLYAGAAEIKGGAFRAIEGQARNELSEWMAVRPPSVTVPAQGEVIATVLIAVPTAAAGGERYAAVLAEQPAVRRSSGVAVAARVGIRVYLNVGGDQEPSSDFVVDSMQAVRQEDGRPAVLARVTNTGARALDMRGELRLTAGPGGLSGGPFPAQLGTTLGVGQSAPVTVVLDEAIRGGPWTATLALQSGLLERRAQARITFPDEAGAEAEPVVAENLSAAKDPKILVPVAGGLIGLIALLLLLAQLRRRSTHQPAEDEREAPVPAG